MKAANMLEDFERWELFYQKGQRTGVLYRRFSANVLLTRVGYGRDPFAYRAESRIRLSADQTGWELSLFRNNQLPEPYLMRPRHGTQTDSMPGYGEFLMLWRLLNSGAPSLEFTRLGDEGSGRDGQGAGAGQLTRLELAPGIDMLRLLKREPLACRRVDVRSSGRVVVRHWVHGDTVVASDWGAARSYRVSGRGADAGWLSLEGMDDGAIRFLTRGFDD